jgi:N-acetylglutamate synthase-like GNAT family acetyltransferase
MKGRLSALVKNTFQWRMRIVGAGNLQHCTVALEFHLRLQRDGAIAYAGRRFLEKLAMVDIVPFAPLHAAGVAALILPIQQAEFGIPITLNDQPDLQDIPNFYQRDLGNFWVALDTASGTNVVVGTLGLLHIGNGEVALRKMFVDAVFRGPDHRVAKRLLDTATHWSREKGIRDIFLGTTAKFLAAHRFYEKNGFCEISRSDLPSRFPVMTVDTKFYRSRVHP